MLAFYQTHQETFFHISLILSVFFFVWKGCLKGEYLIDDDQGIQPYSERWVVEKDKDGKFVKEYKVDSYEIETGARDEKGALIKVKRGFLSIIPELGFPGMFVRWLRLHIGKKWQVIGKNQKGWDIYGYIQSPFRHHAFSLFIQSLNLLLAYSFLSRQFGSDLALKATLLFSVIPLASQTVCWISGLGYLVCLFFTLLGLNVVSYVDSYWLTIPFSIACTFASGSVLLPGAFTWIIYIFLGHYWEAFATFFVFLALMARDGFGLVSFRVKAFKEQNMGESTLIHPNKVVYVFKTLYYYLTYVWMPVRLGLYHVFAYHHDEELYQWDKMFYGGILIFLGVAGSFYWLPFVIQFAIGWFFTYYIVFSNLITAQQSVTERYVFIPSLGICVILTHLFKDMSAIYWVLFGLYAMRSYCHVWTYQDQCKFYLSNWINFPKSEVALGNLGVIVNGRGYVGMANDIWRLATEVNPLYDVPWYDLHTLAKQHGNFGMARDFLKRALDSKIVHFKKQWDNEYSQLDAICKRVGEINEVQGIINKLFGEGKIAEIEPFKAKLIALQSSPVVFQVPHT